MRYFEIVDPIAPEDGDWRPSIKILSEKEILRWYFPFWKNKMVVVGKEEMVNEDKCLEDFAIVHWAVYIGDF